MKYRKKPVIIEATQWFKNGDHPDDYTKDHKEMADGYQKTWSPIERKEHGREGDVVRYFRHPAVDGSSKCVHCGHTMHEHGWVETLEGGHTVCVGDYIITGVKGEYYPCKPDIFELTYEPIGDV